jgi:hypothetical protein
MKCTILSLFESFQNFSDVSASGRCQGAWSGRWDSDAGALLDEVQRAPELLSYLQGMVDEDPRPGRFVLTGSQQLDVLAGVS